MAVRTSNFEIAADAAEKSTPVEEENVAELQHGNGRFSLWRLPTSGQYAMFRMRLSRTDTTEQSRAIDRFLGAVVLTSEEVVEDGRLDAEGVSYAQRVEDGETAVDLDFFWDMVERGVIEEETLVEMLREAIEIHSGFPTSQERGSSRSQRRSGPPSTAGSRRVGSTRSSSASAAS